MPPRLAGEPLHGQRGAARRLDRQALLGPAEHRAHRLGPGEAAEQEVDEPLLPVGHGAIVVEGDVEPARADRLAQRAGQRGPAGRDPQTVRARRARLFDKVGIAHLGPARPIDRLEPVLKDEDLAGTLDHRRDPGPGDRDGPAGRALGQPDQLLVHRSEASRDPLAEAQLDPERRETGGGVRLRTLEDHHRTGLERERLPRASGTKKNPLAASPRSSPATRWPSGRTSVLGPGVAGGGARSEAAVAAVSRSRRNPERTIRLACVLMLLIVRPIFPPRQAPDLARPRRHAGRFIDLGSD